MSNTLNADFFFHIVSWFGVGTEYQRLGELNAAVDYFQQALLVEPRYAGANNLGTAYFDQGRYPEAVRADRLLAASLIYWSPTETWAFFSSCPVNDIRRLLFKDAVRISPHKVEAQNDLGIGLYMMRRYEDAIAAFTQANSIRTEMAEPHFNLACAYLATSNTNGALREHETLRQLNPKLARQLYLIIYQNKLVDISSIRRVE
jgi:tetratricopeptide (TPR) repeat protein